MEAFRVVSDNFGSWLSALNGFVWGPWMLALLLGTHIFLTIRLRFIQRYIGRGIRLSFAKDEGGKGDVSHFGALTTSLAATIGTGNIVGVAFAITAGGPGALFWMWLTGVFGISTKYAEALLAVKYRVTTESGHFAGGPMYVLDRGLKCRWLGVAFAVFTAIAAFGIGNMVQANAISEHLTRSGWGISTWVTGVVLMSLTAMVVLGGIRSIARVCQVLVPFMAIAYVLGCLVLLVIGFRTIPATLALILQSAFTGHAIVGGFLGEGMRQAIRYGIARGLFSNESGLGSAPIVAAAARTKDPVRQALVSSTGTFWDTVVICALTGVVLVNSGEWIDGSLTGPALSAAAFGKVPYVGAALFTMALTTFVFSTILGWSYYGERAAEYLFGKRSILPYRLLWVLFVLVGAISLPQAVWDFADIANALMAVPNLVSLILLSGVVVAETRSRLWQAPALEPLEPASIEE